MERTNIRIMKQYLLKDALLVGAVVLGIVSSIGKFNIPYYVFIAIFLAYAFLRYTDKKIIIKK